MVALTRLARDYGTGAILISELAKSERLPQRCAQLVGELVAGVMEPRHDRSHRALDDLGHLLVRAVLKLA